MAKTLKFTMLAAAVSCLVSCETAAVKPASSTPAVAAPVQKVRTTAYTHSEGSSRNAIGSRLSSGDVKSAGSDWSRFPLGTRFRVVQTGQEYVIDDYGGALVGTSTIDLYKPSRGEMNRWGVRHVDIEILHWGSEVESLKVLKPRKGSRIVRRMVASLENKSRG